MDARAGMSYALKYTLKIIAAYSLVLALVAVILYRLDLGLEEGISSDTYSGVLPYSVKYILPLVPVVVLAFFAGGHQEGSKARLRLRVCMNLALMAAIVLISGEFSYAVNGLVLDGNTGLVSPEASMEVHMPWVSALLLVVPVLAMADAVLEYMQFRDRSNDLAL